MCRSQLFVGLFVAALASISHAQVTVWVDFTSDLHNAIGGGPNGKADWIDELDKATGLAGVTTFTTTERSDIETEILSQLATIYTDYDVTFTTTMPSSGVFDAIAYGKSSFGFSSLGIAPNDPMNISAGHVGAVATGNFDFVLDEFTGVGSRALQMTQMSTALAGTGAHELGHTFGLNHHHAYSHSSITPTSLSPLTYGPTSGLQNAYVMATGSTGIDETEREIVRSFSPWGKAMLDFAGGATAAYPSGFDHQKLVTAPVPITLAEDGPPDLPGDPTTPFMIPLLPGETSGMLLGMVAGDLDGMGSDTDMYKLIVPPGSWLLTAEIFSDNRFAAPFDFDATIALLDMGGAMITATDDVLHLGDVFGASTFQQDDPFLLNIPVTAGLYHLLVHGSPIPSIPAGPGDAYWMAVGLMPVPEPGLGLALVAALWLLPGARRRA